MPINFNFNTVTRFDNPAVDNEVALNTQAQSDTAWANARNSLGLPAGSPVRWRVALDVTVDAYTPRGNIGQHALGYIDARPSFDTAAEFQIASAANATANRGTRLRFPTVIAEFQYPDPQFFVFMVNIGSSGPTSWVELRSITGTATELLPV